MPCNCDHLKPNSHETESRIACQNLKYILEAQDKPVPSQVRHGAFSSYGNTAILKEVTVALCDECRKLDSQEQDKIIYDGRSKKARALAEWWEAHQEADKKREAKELTERKLKVLVNNALAKLSKQEIEALRKSKF